MSSGRGRGSGGGAGGEGLRSSCNDLARTLARLPASIMEGLSRSLPRRRGHGHQLRPPPPPPPPVPLPPPPLVPEELFFFAAFEQRYGGHHPFFYGCRFADALRAARREGKLVFVYLHDPGHPYTDAFCRGTLCADVVVEFLDANFVSWGAVAVAGSGEGPGMAASLRPGSFPFCAVVAPVSDESIAVLQQVEGPVSPSELVEILQRTIDEQGAAFSVRPSRPIADHAAAASRPSMAEEEERRRAAQQLRQEQDAAYLESLRKDQEKERSRKSLQEGAAKPKASNELRPRPPSHGARDPSKTTAPAHQKGASPSHRAEADTKILIRFPNGERRQQSFCQTDTIREIFRFVDSLGVPGIGGYQLVRSYPRKTYGHQQLGMTLRDAGLHPSATLYIEQIQ
ncbi:hypothetical protein ACP4OV_025371 [Aristida adscensionis]